MGLLYQRIFPIGFVEAGGSYVENKTLEVNSIGATLNSSIRSKKYGNITPVLSATVANW